MAGIGESLGLAIGLIGMLLGLGAIIVPVLVLLNFRGIRITLIDKGRRIPGFRSGTTWKAIVGSFGYLLILSLSLMVVGGSMLPPDPIEVQDASLSRQEMVVGDSIDVSGVIVNNGNDTETETVDLTVGTDVVDSKEISLPPGEARQIRFTTTIDEAGDYEIELHGEVVGVIAVEPTPTPIPTPTPTPTPTSTPTPTPTPVLTTTISPSDDDYYTNLMRLTLESGGYDVSSIEVANGRPNGGDKTVIVSTKSSAQTVGDLASEIGAFSGTFEATVEAGWDIDAMIVVMGDQRGYAVGTFYVEEEWIQSYLRGEISRDELSARILNTLEPM